MRSLFQRISWLAQALRRHWMDLVPSLASPEDRLPRWFENVPVRQGLKMAIAGMLGFYVALWQGLRNPSWCIFSVVVLTMAQYVGAIAEKSLLRVIGTVVGALLASRSSATMAASHSL